MELEDVSRCGCRQVCLWPAMGWQARRELDGYVRSWLLLPRANQHKLGFERRVRVLVLGASTLGALMAASVPS